MKTPKILLVSLLLIWTRGGAQELSHIQFTVKDGLPGSAVYQSLQDRSGFVWFCTDQGVSRFDGKTFRNYSKKDGLPDNDILKLFMDSGGNIWFISLKGIPSVLYKGAIWRMDSCKGVYAITEDARTGNMILATSFVEKGFSWEGYYSSTNNPGAWRFKPTLFPVNVEKAGNGVDILRMSSSKKLNFYFGYDKGGDMKIGVEGPAGTVWHSFHHSSPSNFLPVDHMLFYCLLPDQQSTIFFGDSLYFADSGRLENLLPLSKLVVRRKDINDIYAENDSTLWISTRNRGLILIRNILQPGARTIQSYFPDAFITSLRKDREGGYWVTTHNDGVYYLPDIRVRYVTAGGEFVDKDIKCIREVGDGSLVTGLSNGHIALVDCSGSRVRSFMPWDCVNKNNRPVDIAPLGNNRFAVASDQNFSIFSPVTGTDPVDMNISAKGVCFLPDLGILYGAFEGLYLRNDNRSDYLFNSRVTCVSGIGHTCYWGTLNGLYSGDAKVISTKPTSKLINYWATEPPLLAGIINHIDIGKDSTIWVSTQQGVVILKGKDHFTIATAQGLSSDLCKSVSIAGPVAWVSTDKGISRIDLSWSGAKPSYTISHITENDGLVSNTVNQTALAGGYVWAATARGLSFFPMDYIPHSTQEPLIHINNPDLVSLDYLHTKLIIDLSGISFRSGKELTYQYRLADIDTNWISTPNNRLEFSTLPFGTHIFEARVIDRWGKASTAKSITILLPPPFWRRPWFIVLAYLLVLIVTVAGLYAYFKWRHDKKDRSFRLRSKMADLEMMALRAQMNPHFIFNCLSSIQDFILGADVRNANLYLYKLSALIRRILQHSPRSYSTLTEELAVLGLYMELEKLRLSHRMEYSIEVAEDLRPSDIQIPSLILQPFAENAIRHGISPLEDRKGVVRIDFRRIGSQLICTIEDNGIGILTSAREKQQEHAYRQEHTSMGLNIISNRIRILNAIRKESVKLDISDKSTIDPLGQGTIAKIYFSL